MGIQYSDLSPGFSLRSEFTFSTSRFKGEEIDRLQLYLLPSLTTFNSACLIRPPTPNKKDYILYLPPYALSAIQKQRLTLPPLELIDDFHLELKGFRKRSSHLPAYHIRKKEGSSNLNKVVLILILLRLCSIFFKQIK